MKARNAAIYMFLAILAVPVTSNAQEYDFAVHSKFVNITFESRMDVEDIIGTSNSITGVLSLKGDSGKFKLAVPVDTLKTGIAMRDDHIRSEHWLNSAKYPNISFSGASVTDQGEGKYEVAGKFIIKGVEKATAVQVQTRKIPASLAKKLNMGEGSWLRVRAEFKVKLSDYGVKIPDMAAAKVNDEWTVKVSLFAKEK